MQACPLADCSAIAISISVTVQLSYPGFRFSTTAFSETTMDYNKFQKALALDRLLDLSDEAFSKDLQRMVSLSIFVMVFFFFLTKGMNVKGIIIALVCT